MRSLAYFDNCLALLIVQIPKEPFNGRFGLFTIQMKKFKTIDLCAGIGGIRRGFELAGCFENVLSAEIDPYARKTYKHLYGEDPRGDLTSQAFKEEVNETDYDVLLAGFPCQTFSSAGLKKGFSDETKGQVFFHITEILEVTKPKAVFLENVEYLVRHNKGETFSEILRILRQELGYKIVGVSEDTGDFDWRSFVRNTKDFGLPQNRSRVYIVGFLKEYFKNWKDIPNELPQKRDREAIFESLESVIDYGAPEKFFISSGYLDTLKRHKIRQKNSGNGYGYCVLNDEKKLISNTILATGGSGKERNLIRDEKGGLLAKGKILPGRRSPVNEDSIRIMTPKEWGRLQGFIGYAFVNKEGIDKFSFPKQISLAQQYKQFGNSVSIPVVEEIANFMKDILRSSYLQGMRVCE